MMTSSSSSELAGEPATSDLETRLAAAEAEVVTRLKHVESAEHAAWLAMCSASMAERQLFLAEHVGRPRTYLGRPQPGASPSFYGPDAVVVDGDWLEALERRYALLDERAASDLALSTRLQAELTAASTELAWVQRPSAG